MPRRSDHSREEIRELALEAVKTTIASEGVSGVTVRKIADAIGYSVGTIYNICAGVEELIAEVNGQTITRLEEDVRSAIANAAAPVYALSALTGALGEFIVRERNLAAALFDNLPSGGEVEFSNRQRMAGIFLSVSEVLSSMFPDLDEVTLKKSSEVLAGSIYGLFSLAGKGRLADVSPDEPEKIAEFILGIYMAGIKSLVGRKAK